MICKIHGKIEKLDTGIVTLDLSNGLWYELLVSAYTESQLRGKEGQPITLHTIHSMESSSQGTTFIPRLAAFVNETDKAFYVLFTTVKGIGPKKALNCLTMNTAQLAGAIADRDVKLIQTLPGIGKRMAETIVASLHGKVDHFVSDAAYGAGDDLSTQTNGIRGSAAREALEVLLQLGENRAFAVSWIDQVLTKNPDCNESQEIITLALQIKSSG